MSALIPIEKQQITEDFATLFNRFFIALQTIFPAWHKSLPTTEHLESAKRQWLTALKENGILSQTQLNAGLRKARAEGRDCVFLVDDLPSELDRVHRRQLCQLLGGMRCQVLLSCVDASELSGCWDGLAANEMKLFHVEHGALSAAK